MDLEVAPGHDRAERAAVRRRYPRVACVVQRIQPAHARRGRWPVPGGTPGGVTYRLGEPRDVTDRRVDAGSPAARARDGPGHELPVVGQAPGTEADDGLDEVRGAAHAGTGSRSGSRNGSRAGSGVGVGSSAGAGAAGRAGIGSSIGSTRTRRDGPGRSSALGSAASDGRSLSGGAVREATGADADTSARTLTRGPDSPAALGRPTRPGGQGVGQRPGASRRPGAPVNQPGLTIRELSGSPHRAVTLAGHPARAARRVRPPDRSTGEPATSHPPGSTWFTPTCRGVPREGRHLPEQPDRTAPHPRLRRPAARNAPRAPPPTQRM